MERHQLLKQKIDESFVIQNLLQKCLEYEDRIQKLERKNFGNDVILEASAKREIQFLNNEIDHLLEHIPTITLLKN